MFAGSQNQFSFSSADGNDVFGCKNNSEECSALAEVWTHAAHLNVRKTTAPNLRNEMLCSWSNISQSQPACHFSLNVCGPHVIPPLFFQPLPAVRKLESHLQSPTSSEPLFQFEFLVSLALKFFQMCYNSSV